MSAFFKSFFFLKKKISSLSLHSPKLKLLTVPPHMPRVVRVVVPGLVVHLTEQPLDASTHRVRVIDVDVVVLCIRRLFHKGLVDPRAAELDVVLGLDEAGRVEGGEVREARRGFAVGLGSFFVAAAVAAVAVAIAVVVILGLFLARRRCSSSSSKSSRRRRRRARLLASASPLGHLHGRACCRAQARVLRHKARRGLR